MDSDMYERLVEAIVQVASDSDEWLEQLARCYALTLTEAEAKKFLGEDG